MPFDKMFYRRAYLCFYAVQCNKYNSYVISVALGIVCLWEALSYLDCREIERCQPLPKYLTTWVKRVPSTSEIRFVQLGKRR